MNDQLQKKLIKLSEDLDNASLQDLQERFVFLNDLKNQRKIASKIDFEEIFKHEALLMKSHFHLEGLKKAESELKERLKIKLKNAIGAVSLSMELQNENDSNFIHEQYLEILRTKANKKFGIKKLIQLLIELNCNYKCRNVISSLMILRAILNYVPPIFGEKTFGSVVIKLDPSPQKGRNEILDYLQNGARKMADSHTHGLITNQEQELPTLNQIEPYKPNFEYLIQELIKKL